MNFFIPKVEQAGALVAGAAGSLATMFSEMPSTLAVPINTLLLAMVGIFIRWVEKKVLKEKITEQVKKELGNTAMPNDSISEKKISYE